MGQAERFAASLTEEGRYRLLIEAITDYAIYMLDPAGIVTSWNPGAQRLKGYEESEILGEHFSRFHTEEDRRAGLPERSLRTAARDGTFESEGWRLRKDGSRFWAHVIIDPIKSPAGDLVGFAKVTRDLTERKQAEALLRQSESQFRLLVESVTDQAIYLLDPGGQVDSWNPGAERITGYRPEEVVGRHFSLFHTPEDRDRGEPARTLETAIREGRFETEAWRVRKGGERFWAHVSIDPIRNEDGAIVGFAKVTHDLTEATGTRVALDRARDAIFQAQKMEAIGQLTGGVAHDFNNILTAVLGGLEIVMRRLPENPNITPLLQGAIQAAQRGVSLTQRMMAFGRRQELRPETVALQALLRAIMDIIIQTLGPRITLDTDFPEAPLTAHVDVDQLELAVINLLMNARDSMPSGGSVRISLSARAVDSDEMAGFRLGRYVCLSVADTGEGMDEATFARAMEPFFSTRGVGKGTGLGLSMVHGFAEQSGGKLLLNSRKGEGTTAEIWLPVEA
ncbi:hybrid sensor histidine kinase/response regulator [Rhodopila globiformis]|uniref:histidine kinase n=2 Tax=Rhodopila globiformis TaxID=1071 RepID=A0A2S6NJA3_RHOGL|nr:hybrid sensor histidine kinase/response regulator [Rhodopila globiformis]